MLITFTLSVTVDTEPPPAPTLISPENDSYENTSTPTFDWQAVTDPSGVTYTLQCSTDPAFTEVWTRRKQITIESTGTLLENYQVKITVPYDSDMQPDFDDLRFTDSDETTPLSYWVENYNLGVNATVWVKVPSVETGNFLAEFFVTGGAMKTAVEARTRGKNE